MQVSGNIGNKLKIKNNIFYKEGPGLNTVIIQFDSINDYEVGSENLDYNLYKNTSGATAQIDFQNTSPVNWNSGNREGHGIEIDPGFLEPVDYLYKLQYSSPAKNIGLNLYTDITTDILGKKRPYWDNNSFDLGVYEIPDAQFKIGVTGVTSAQEVNHTITPIGKNWERDYQGNWEMTTYLTSSTYQTTGNNNLNLLNTWQGWDFDWLNQGSEDPNAKFRLGFYKLTNNISNDCIYLDFRDGDYSITYEPQIYIMYIEDQDPSLAHFEVNLNGIWTPKNNGDIIRVWDLKGVPIPNTNTNLLPYYWSNALIRLVSTANHPLLVWGPHPSQTGNYTVRRKYGSFPFVDFYQTSNLLYEDVSVTLDAGEDPDVVLVQYKIRNSSSQETNVVEYTVVSIFGKAEPDALNLSFKLNQNYPNPFNPQTKISFTVPEDGKVNLTVYDLLGNEIITLIDDNLTAGMYDVDFNAVHLSSGVYFYRLSAGKNIETRKLQLIK